MDEGEEVETCLVKLLTLVEHCPSVYNEPPRQTPPPMSLGARQVIADTVVVKKNFTFLKTPFPLHGVKTVVLGTYRCRTVLENYRRLIITFMC